MTSTSLYRRLPNDLLLEATWRLAARLQNLDADSPAARLVESELRKAIRELERRKAI